MIPRTLIMKPVVTIGMPVYNGETFIREALDSLLAQTFTDFELIISDNASTDGTDASCRKYAERDSRIRYIRQAENRGAVANFQFVLDEAVGKYFMWAAADDMLGTAETLSNLVKSLDDGFELAIPDVDLLDKAKGVTSRGVLSSVFLKLKQKTATELALQFPSFLLYGLFVTASLRPFFIYLKRDSDLSCFNEGVFVHAVTATLRCVFVENALLIYRRHSTNASSTVTPPALLKSFFIYTARVFAYYSRSAYSTLDKLYFLSVLSLKHARYILVLVAQSGKYYWRGAAKWLGFHRDGN